MVSYLSHSGERVAQLPSNYFVAHHLQRGSENYRLLIIEAFHLSVIVLRSIQSFMYIREEEYERDETSRTHC